MKQIIFLFLCFSFYANSNPGTKSLYKTEVVLSRSEVIWGFDFLTPETIIFTERSGKLFLYHLKTKKISEVTGVPPVYSQGQGGLLDVKVHPKNGYIYLTYSEPTTNDKSTTALGRGKIEGEKLAGFTKLFSAEPSSDNDYHYGSRVVFDNQGHLFLSVGERGERKLIQKLDNHLGKIIRLNEDGSVPKDNPYVGNPKAKPELWSYGHRNPQGLCMNQERTTLWEVEMGPRGGDELNLIIPKKNYGWPEITYGREYYGPKIGEGTKRADVEEPVSYWVPSISPSGMTFYTGDKMPEWKGNIFLGLLSGEHIRRIELKDNKVVKQEELLKELEWRFRQLQTGPDGYLWFSTDEGKIGRILKK